MFAAEVPSRIRGLLRNFNATLTKPQKDNLAKIIFGMLEYEEEKYINKKNYIFNPPPASKRATWIDS